MIIRSILFGVVLGITNFAAYHIGQVAGMDVAAERFQAINQRGYIRCENGAWQIGNIDFHNETFTLPPDSKGLIWLDNAWCNK